MSPLEQHVELHLYKVNELAVYVCMYRIAFLCKKVPRVSLNDNYDALLKCVTKIDHLDHNREQRNTIA